MGEDLSQGVGSGASPALTLRALAVGLASAVAVDVLIPVSAYRLGSSRLVFSYLPMGVLLVFGAVVAGLNVVLGAIRRSWALTSAELAVVFAMTLVASAFPALGFVGYLLGIISTPYYFASPENQWGELLLPHLPEWALPPEGSGALEWFYNGLPPGRSIPWSAWVVPLFWWGTLIAAIVLVSVALMVMLRRQWVERERLVFPLAEVPAELIQQETRRGWLHNRLFWLGFLIPFGIILWNIISYFYPFFPTIPLVGTSARLPWISVARDFPGVCLKVNFFIIGFAYLTRADVLLSVWVFQVAAIVFAGVSNRLGFRLGSPDVWTEISVAQGWASFGCLTFLVVWGVWMAREHLREVWRKALGRAPEVDDSQELMSYRAAVVSLGLGLAYITAWLHALGMPWVVAAVFLAATFILYLGICKIVAQTGLTYVRATLTAQSFTYYGLGTGLMGPQGVTAVGLTYGFVCDTRPLHFAAVGHIAKLCDLLAERGAFRPQDKRRMLWAIVAAALVGGVVSVWVTLLLGYRHGAYNFGAWHFSAGNISLVQNVVSKLRSPVPVDWARLGSAAVGAGLAAGLTLLMYRVSWWRLSPIGLAVCGSWPITVSWFSVFITWVIKTVVLRVGGNDLYQRSRALFIGLLFGYVAGVGLSLAVDVLFFYGEGHRVHYW